MLASVDRPATAAPPPGRFPQAPTAREAGFSLALRILCTVAALSALTWSPAGRAAADYTTELEPLAELAWLAGCWSGRDGGRLSEECWLHPEGGLMLGINRTVDGDRTAFEFLRIVDEGGAVTLLASPAGSEPVPFTLTEVEPSRAVFANPEHDFPQRITYAREGERLVATVEAQRDGEWRGFDLVWTRSRLSGGLASRAAAPTAEPLGGDAPEEDPRSGAGGY